MPSLHRAVAPGGGVGVGVGGSAAAGEAAASAAVAIVAAVATMILLSIDLKWSRSSSLALGPRQACAGHGVVSCHSHLCSFSLMGGPVTRVTIGSRIGG